MSHSVSRNRCYSVNVEGNQCFQSHPLLLTVPGLSAAQGPWCSFSTEGLSLARVLSVRGLLGWFIGLDFNGLYNRFPNVPPVGSRFRGLKRSHRTVWFGQRKRGGVCFRHVGVWTLLCSCVDTVGQQAIIRFHVLLQRKMFSFQFSESAELDFSWVLKEHLLASLNKQRRVKPTGTSVACPATPVGFLGGDAL